MQNDSLVSIGFCKPKMEHILHLALFQIDEAAEKTDKDIIIASMHKGHQAQQRCAIFLIIQQAC
ncbi:hypothetical protein EJB05_53266, partial [Eragrostis curvula]